MAKRAVDVFIVSKVPSLAAPEAEAAIKILARLLGRQMAREYLAKTAGEKNVPDDVG
jgi:hypothetical protein